MGLINYSNAPKIIGQNFPSKTKIWDFSEKRLHWASTVHALHYVFADSFLAEKNVLKGFLKYIHINNINTFYSILYIS